MKSKREPYLPIGLGGVAPYVLVCCRDGISIYHFSHVSFLNVILLSKTPQTKSPNPSGRSVVPLLVSV